MTGGVLVAYIILFVVQMAKVNAANQMKTISVQDVASLRPTSGNYQVTGGRLNYVYAQAVGFTNDHDKDAGTSFDSYIPYVDDKTGKTNMLVKMLGESPKSLLSHIDDPGGPVIGFFHDPSTVEPEIYQDFANRKYDVSPDLPVMEMFGGVDPAAVRSKLILIGVVLLLGLGGLWTLMYFKSRPKQRRKTFSERYPDRRIY